eukprot:2212676-Lingulodinium_polyedra.AAC.1
MLRTAWFAACCELRGSNRAARSMLRPRCCANRTARFCKPRGSQHAANRAARSGSHYAANRAAIHVLRS